VLQGIVLLELTLEVKLELELGGLRGLGLGEYVELRSEQAPCT